MGIAFIFPGQGSQSVGMLADFYENFVTVRDTIDEASDCMQTNLWQIIKNGPAEKLNQTTLTQPAVFVCGVALWRLLCENVSIKPVVAAGHSLGEYTALVASGTLSFIEGLKTVMARAKYMQAAVPEGQGAMAAIIGLDDEQVDALCQAYKIKDEIVSAVNFNAPGQVVIAGNTASIHAVMQQAQSAGAKIAKLLPVSVPSHCELMLPAKEKLKEVLSTLSWHDAHFPVLRNIDAMAHTQADAIITALCEQVVQPVKWTQTIKNMVQQYSVERCIECGPNRVLTGLNRRIDKSLQTSCLMDITNFEKVISSL